MSEFIISTISGGGYLGIFTLMVIENVFPPIPSELVLPFVGFLVADGVFHPVLAVLVATIGSTVGALPWYFFGWYLNTERITSFLKKYGVYIAVSCENFMSTVRIFDRYQNPAVFFGRLLPTIRTFISVPAGSIKMRLSWFILLTFAGSLIWNITLIGMGYRFRDHYSAVSVYVDPLVTIIFATLALLYLYNVVKYLLNREHQNADS